MTYQITNSKKTNFLKYRFLCCLFLFSIISCKQDSRLLTAQQIIDKSIKISGVYKLYNSTLSFNFRDKKYIAERNSGAFVLKRISTMKDFQIEDQLSNQGFQRFINFRLSTVVDSMAVKYIESVNSVHYFSVLPFGLNDQAVQKKLLESINIKGKKYYKVQITFTEDGGGVDFDDIFIYWIGQKDFKIDYLAYTFHVNGGGMRFREVKKEHLIEGTRLLDYNNFKPKDEKIKLYGLDKAFENNELIKASEINLENIKITFN
tara:strand:+ start:161 stop:943 length:783 start_codon:yes stop_codon:yes gene_type:complete